MYVEKFDVKAYVQKQGLVQVQDRERIETLVIQALQCSPQAVEDYKKGNEKALHFIVGLVMRETKGTAKPQLVNEILREQVEKV